MKFNLKQFSAGKRSIWAFREEMGERRLVNNSVLSSRLRRLTRPGSLKRRSPQKSQIQKNLNELIACDLVGIAKTLKKSTVSCLSLFQKHADLQKRIAENRKLGFLGYRHSEALFTFSRAVAWALSGSGWLQELELGFALWERDLRIIAESLGRSTTLKRLSFANSELGDHSLHILGKSLQECAQLEILNLSACALTDAIAPLLSAIVKAHVCRRAQADWQASLRSSKGVNALTIRPKGLIALDISLNHLTDIATQTICSVLRIGTPLEALNLRSNQLTRISGKLLLDVMEEWAILRFVDLRDNTDNRLMGVLEDGQHLTTFSQVQAPFWMTSPSIKLKRTRSKTSSKQPRALNGWEDAKLSVRPRSAPSSTLPTHLQAKGHHKPPQSTKRHVDYTKNSPRFCTTDDKSDKNHTRRPSTCPTKHHYTTEKQLPSSCSTSLEFAAWEYDDPNTKENRLPFQMSKANALGSDSGMLEGCMSDEELTWKESIQTKPLDKVKHKLPHVTRIRPEEVAVLRPVDMTKSDRFGENIDSINCQGPKFKPREGSKPGLRNPKCLKPQLENPYGTYDENGGVYEEPQQKNDLHKSGIRNLPSKTFSTSRTTIQTTEWNSFLKEITQAILHLQGRLDELIGPADPDSLAEQATSQLQVLFR